MKLLLDWTAAIPGQPRPVRFFWYGDSLSRAVKQKRFLIRIKNIETGEWIEEEDPIDDKIPAPGLVSYWKRIGKKDGFFIYTIDPADDIPSKPA